MCTVNSDCGMKRRFEILGLSENHEKNIQMEKKSKKINKKSLVLKKTVKTEE